MLITVGSRSWICTICLSPFSFLPTHVTGWQGHWSTLRFVLFFSLYILLFHTLDSPFISLQGGVFLCLYFHGRLLPRFICFLFICFSLLSSTARSRLWDHCILSVFSDGTLLRRLYFPHISCLPAGRVYFCFFFLFPCSRSGWSLVFLHTFKVIMVIVIILGRLGSLGFRPVWSFLFHLGGWSIRSLGGLGVQRLL